MCPICSNPIFHSEIGDMHEALITRGAVSGHKDQDFIYHPCNCVIRHHICPNGLGSHTPGSGSDEDYKKCLMQIVDFEGEQSVVKWLLEARDHFPVVGQQAITRFVAVSLEISDEVNKAVKEYMDENNIV